MYKSVLAFMDNDRLFYGLLPGFVSFGRIFYLENISFYLVFYLSFLLLFILSSLLFVALSLRLRVFRRTWHPILIAMVYVAITCLLSVNAYFSPASSLKIRVMRTLLTPSCM